MRATECPMDRLIGLVAEHGGIERGSAVLDLGCGAGQLAIAFARLGALLARGAGRGAAGIRGEASSGLGSALAQARTRRDRRDQRADGETSERWVLEHRLCRG